MKSKKLLPLLLFVLLFSLKINAQEIQEDKITTLKSISVLSQRISLNANNESIKNILKDISVKYNISFVYDDKLLNSDNITINFNDEPLFKVLEDLLEPINLGYYEFSNRKITLAKIKKIRDKTGGIYGTITDDKGYELIGANVVIKELIIGAASNSKGTYLLKNIKPGTYNVEVTFVGYEKYEQKIKVQQGQLIELNIKLISNSFQIGGIEVVGSTELLPKDVNTKTNISSGEVEHYQASSLKDVLDLVPGVQKTANQGLDKTGQISIRGDEGDNLSTFGTLIMVDGTPMSNNSNMQFEKMTGGEFGNSNVGAGIDLRTIPADNIESIEVITGLPSVKYGDVTSGIINVQTKIGPSPQRLKIKNNPDTREANLGGGFLINKDGLSYNVNVARSERDIRKTGDEYYRITGQTVYSSNLFQDQLNTNFKVAYQTVLDNEEPQGDMLKTRNYNRGYNINVSSWGTYKPNENVSSLDYNLFGTMNRINSMKSRLVQSDNRVLPNGDTVATYMGKVETKGIEWTVGGRLEYNEVFYTGPLIHKILIGTDPQYNANTGQGLVFDTLYNYYGSTSGRRPYNFNSIPGQFLMSAYGEDKITGHILSDFNLMVGFRYEMYKPYKFNLKGLVGKGDIIDSYQGTFFNPRLNLMVYLSKYNQIRISAGKSSKSPSMSVLYPPTNFLKWRNPKDSTVNYYLFDTKVPYLKGYQETQYEVAFDQKISNIIGTSISAYYKMRKGESEAYTTPIFYSERDNLDNLYFAYVANYTIPQNLGNTESKGLEFSLRTAKIQPLNMEFQITGAYSFIKNMSNTKKYDLTPDSSLGQYPNYKVPTSAVDTLVGMFYNSSYRWSDRFQINYYLKYTCRPLGLWVTLRAEELLFERGKSNDIEPEDYNKLSETNKQLYNFARSLKNIPGKWLFSMNISKSLFKGAEISFYVNNFMDNAAVLRTQTSPGVYSETVRNPDLSYGIEFSMIFDNLFSRDSNE